METSGRGLSPAGQGRQERAIGRARPEVVSRSGPAKGRARTVSVHRQVFIMWTTVSIMFSSRLNTKAALTDATLGPLPHGAHRPPPRRIHAQAHRHVDGSQPPRVQNPL